MEARGVVPGGQDEQDRPGDLHKSLGQRMRAKVASGSDNLAAHYTGMADDGTQSAGKREAAILFVVAEGLLNKGDAPLEGLSAATKALEAARNTGDEDVVADALRLVLNAHLQRASMDRYRQQASAKTFGTVSARACEQENQVQKWVFNSTTGQLKSGGGFCLSARHRSAKNSEVEVRECDPMDEDQQWSLWSVQQLSLRSSIEAMRQEALEPTTTTDTSTITTTATATTTVSGPTLYCFSVMVSWAYEPTLVGMQANHQRSIFLCDGFDVYSDKVMTVGDKPYALTTRRVHGTDLKCHKGGVFNTLLNTPVFIKVW